MKLLEFGDKSEWLEARRSKITGTAAATIMGANPWSSPMQLWGEMTGRIEAPDLSDNQAVQLGVRLEPVVRDWFYEETGYQSSSLLGQYTMVEHPDIEFIGGTPDDIYNADDGQGVLEIKTTGAHMAHLWEEDPPLSAQVQAQFYAACAGLPRCAYAVLIGGQTLKTFEQDRNDDFVSVMLEELDRWWHVHIKGDQAPAPDASESTRRALEALYRADTGVDVDLGDEALRWAAQRQEAASHIKEWEAQKREAENHLKSLIGDATTGRLPDGTAFTWKTQTRVAYEVAEKTFRVLRKQGASK